MPKRISRLFLMPDCEDCHGIIVDPVSDDIAAVTKIDEPFTERVRQIVNHPAKAGMRA